MQLNLQYNDQEKVEILEKESISWHNVAIDASDNVTENDVLLELCEGVVVYIGLTLNWKAND